METKIQIFVSSTFTDLKSERQAAVEAILKAGHIPAGMELFIAGDQSQWEVIKKWILDSDVYMLILGGRYGSIESSTGLSYTELEYDFAVKSGKPYFAVVIEEKELEKRIKKHGKENVAEIQNPEKLVAFRAKVLSQISSFFCDFKDIKLCVHETLPNIIKEKNIKGWIRASDVPDTKKLADELTNVNNENRELRATIEKQNKQIELKTSSKLSEEKEFEEIIKVMSSIMIDVSGIKNVFANGKKVPNEVSLLSLSISFKDAIMNGITNKYGIDDTGKFAYFTVCPRLQTYELVENEKVTGAQYRRYSITKKGTRFFAYYEKKQLLGKNNNR